MAALKDRLIEMVTNVGPIFVSDFKPDWTFYDELFILSLQRRLWCFKCKFEERLFTQKWWKNYGFHSYAKHKYLDFEVKYESGRLLNRLGRKSPKYIVCVLQKKGSHLSKWWDKFHFEVKFLLKTFATTFAPFVLQEFVNQMDDFNKLVNLYLDTNQSSIFLFVS